MARFSSPISGRGTVYFPSFPSSMYAMTESSPSYIGDGAPSPRIHLSAASMANFPECAGANAFHDEISPLRDWRVVNET